MPKPEPPALPPQAPTGIAGLDEILHGGLPRDEMHLIQGVTGTGKTTLALQFLSEGLRTGEPVLYVTLSQSKQHLERIARSHGWNLDGMVIHELSPGTVASRIAARQTILSTADVELGELFSELSEVVARVRPKRAVVDSITVLEMLAGSPQRYHREVVTLRQLFVEQECTLIALADHPAEAERGDGAEVIFHPLSGCVIHLSQEARPYGDARRRLRIVKARGVPHNGGYHDFKIETGRTDVFSRLGAYDQEESSDFTPLTSGVARLDQMLGGGVESGTSCLIVGASGVGKSSLAALFTAAGAAQGHAAIFLFDERTETYLRRCDGLGIPLREHVEAGRVLLTQLDPGQIAPGEFAQRIRHLVEDQHTRVVVIDSVVGYFAAMGSADVLVTQLHELLTYMTRNNVVSIMCGSQEGFMSIGTQDAVDVSYLSDTIIALTFFELEGELRRALAVVKKKHSPHARAIHELSLAPGKISVGEQPLAYPGLFLAGRQPGARGEGDHA
jgi:circadian clock protein KaiC